MKKERGFTLLEVIFVLAIWSILLTLIVPINVSILQEKKETEFLRTFEMDVLYLQSMSYGSRSYYQMTFDEDNHYRIKKKPSKITLERKIPEGWKIDNYAMPSLTFNSKGTITQPGSFRIQTPSAVYKVVCPLGKGRCYIEKQ